MAKTTEIDIREAVERSFHYEKVEAIQNGEAEFHETEEED